MSWNMKSVRLEVQDTPQAAMCVDNGNELSAESTNGCPCPNTRLLPESSRPQPWNISPANVLEAEVKA
ncbi:hypothetical protein STEG23_001742, partial [Scotinomys teguina]